MKEIIIIGAGGHSRSVLALLENQKYQVIGIVDSNAKAGEAIFGVAVTKDLADLSLPLVLAIGCNAARKESFFKYHTQIFKKTIAHSSAQLEKYVTVGEANLVLANAYLNNAVKIGNNNLINTGAILEHDVEIGSHNHIAVKAVLLGRAKIGDECFIGAGAIIKDGVKLGSNITIGANSFVNRDIHEPGTYIGSPARKIQ